jgi:hypothetical protein
MPDLSAADLTTDSAIPVLVRSGRHEQFITVHVKRTGYVKDARTRPVARFDIVHGLIDLILSMATMRPELSEDRLQELSSRAEEKFFRACRDQLPDEILVVHSAS